MAAVNAGVETTDLRAQLEGREWYHTIELAPGIETPGYFDLRPVAPKVLPASLAGLRCLDVATFDGFWALQLEERGAREVVAIDVLDPRKWDWPVGADYDVQKAIAERKRQGEGFEIVMNALGRSIERHEMSVYDLDPDVVGTFDFVYVGSLLLHLRDPVRALEKVRSVCAGRMLLVDAIDSVLTRMHPRRAVADFDGLGRPWWWKPNAAALERMVQSAGFELIEPAKRVRLPIGPGRDRSNVKLRALRHKEARVLAEHLWIGDPHAAFRARPRPGLEAPAPS